MHRIHSSQATLGTNCRSAFLVTSFLYALVAIISFDVLSFEQRAFAQSEARFVSLPGSSSAPLAVMDVIKSGEELERKGLWGDALTLYERAQKELGKSSEIQEDRKSVV